MRDETAAVLNELDRRFYRERAAEFSATRERPWPGWDELLAMVRLPPDPRVLDVGCGNGRFARFLQNRIGERFGYVGIDQSPPALAEARRRLGDRDDLLLVEHDFVASRPLPASLASRHFDLAVLFGVLHHVPGRRRRRELLEGVARRLAPGGFLGYSIWRFLDHERFRRKLVPWSQLERRCGMSVDLSDLEPGDYLMTWGARDDEAVRYCHAPSEEEEEELRSVDSCSLVTKQDATMEPNRYYLLRAR